VTALSIIKDVCVEIGLPDPSIALASTDPQITQLVRLLNKEGRELSARYAWQVLVREVTFATLAAESQGTIAAIITANDAGHVYRYIINDTIWNRTKIWPVLGPKAPRNWQAYKSMNVTGPISEYRIRGGSLLFSPVPAAGETCAFEYVDRMWCTDDTGATYQQRLVADDDEMLLDEDLMQQGLLWRWRAAKKLDYTEDFLTYERMVADAMARDGTKPTISMCGPVNDYVPGVFVPAGSWNL
jgi:hypothetical protein